MAKKSVSELVDQVAVLAEEIGKQAVAETRRDVARQVEEHFLGGKNVSRTVYDGASPDDCIVYALGEYPTMTHPDLTAAFVRFDADGVSDDFRAGILFAVRLFADSEYDY